ncbi:hypothetical protein AAX09_09225 [Moraxella bovoculi]|nr:hypothetical protein AAX09_09225 [Moraxella bovoculi]
MIGILGMIRQFNDEAILEFLFEGELMFLETDKCLEELNIGDRIEYTIYYETEPPYKPYVVGFRKYIEFNQTRITRNPKTTKNR